MKRLALVLGGMACILLILTIAAAPVQPRPAEARTAPLVPASLAQDGVIASLDPVQGIVQHQPAAANPQDAASWTILRGPVLVSPGDRIRTNGVGVAYLTFFEGVESQIGPNTLVVVSTLDLSDVANENFNISLDVLLGSTLTTIDVTLDAEDRFEIHTPGATAVVRGTTWWTLVHQDGSAEFESVEGAFGVVPHQPPLSLAAAPAAPTESPGESGTESDAAMADEEAEVAEAPAVDPAVAAVWDTWIGFDPGVTSWFAPDGETLEAPAAIRVPDVRGALSPSDTCGDQVCQPLELSACPLDCIDQIDLSSCGNGVCEPGANEDLLLCAEDCSPYAGLSCGDGTCDPDESGLTCAADCAPEQYFSPVMGDLCGNGTCDVTESNLTCAADCTSAVPTAAASAGAGDPDASSDDQCALTAQEANLRSGPDPQFAIVARLLPGMMLYATGISPDGLWYVSQSQGQQVWVATWVVSATGACNVLRVVEPPPLPSTIPTPVWRPGEWGPCGSCDSCGYPSAECMLNPEGACVWNPTDCVQ